MHMKLKNTALAAALGVAGLVGAGTVQAATLSTGNILAFTAGSVSKCAGRQKQAKFLNVSGTYFFMGGKCANAMVAGPSGGIVIGMAQPTGAAHGGAPTGSEDIATSIDQPWSYFGSTGLHYTVTGPSAVTGTTISGIVPLSPTALDFSNWRVAWNTMPLINMGGRASETHKATFAWDGIYGDAFTLEYKAHVPSGPFTGVPYGVHMTGIVLPVQPVPIPAAAWLFGSGLLGLVGIARRRKAS